MRILFSAQTTSTHVVRWIEQLDGTGWDVHVFQAVAKDYGGPALRMPGTLHLPFKRMAPDGVEVHVSLPPGSEFQDVPMGMSQWEVDEFHYRSLAGLIQRLRPDIVHSLGLHVNHHNNCLPLLAAKRLLKERFGAPWVYSSWGTDLDYYARRFDTAHEVGAVLEACDYHISECERDRRLAAELGFRGEFAGFLPAFGGVPVQKWEAFRQPGPTSARRGILLKGRDRTDGDPIGRAMTAMGAFARIAPTLTGCPVRVVQAGPRVSDTTDWLRSELQLDIEVLRYLSYEDLLRRMGSFRICMATTTHDGLPSFLVEAMAMGAFVIHSGIDSVREWITDGVNGLLVDPEDTEAVARAIERAMSDDELVDRAAEINAGLVRDKLDYGKVQQRTLETYERIAAAGLRRG